MFFLPRKDESDSQLTDPAALRPAKLVTKVWELLKAHGFGCEAELILGPREAAVPIERVAADVAAIFNLYETRHNLSNDKRKINRL